MGSSSKTQTQSTSSNTVNPQQMAQYQSNYNTAQQNAGILGQPYTGQLTAGFTPAQVQAQQQLSGVAVNPQYTQNLTGATNAVQGILSNPITAQPVTAAQLSSTDLSPYLNPYTNDVINTTMNQLGQYNQNQLNQNAQGAEAVHAFGNDRLGVQDALTNQYYNQDAAQTLAGLNSQNYTNAQNAALSDIAAQNAMGQFNSSQNVGVQGQNIANTMSEANQVANLTGQNFQMAANQGGLLANVGQQQQQQQQTALSNAYNNWLQGKQLTLDQQQLLNQALSII